MATFLLTLMLTFWYLTDADVPVLFAVVASVVAALLVQGVILMACRHD